MSSSLKMTTISPRRKKRRLSAPALAATVVLIVLATMVVVWRSQAGNLFWVVVGPVVSLRNSLDRAESARLRAELAEANAKLADRDALYQQNLLLKAQFGRDAKTPMILAGVLMRPPGMPYDTLIIDAGKREGIIQGALVSAGGGAYIGTVSDVYAGTSRVTLFSSPGITYSALVALSAHNGTSIPVSLVGEGAGDMSAQVPTATPVTTGDTVVVPGITAAFAGSVSYVERPAGDSFQTLHMHLPVDLFSLQFVEVRATL